MEKAVLHRILDAQEAARTDPAYRDLLQVYQDCSGALHRLLNDLDPRKREVLFAYLDIGARMHLRMMELLCKETQKNTHDL